MSQSQNVSSVASNAAIDNSAAFERASNDMGWEYGILVDPTNLDTIQYKLCGKGQERGPDDEEVEIVGTRKRPHTLGPIDKYVSDINPEKKMTRPQNISASLWKARSEKVDSYLARWVYEAGIPFHAIDNNSFTKFCEAVGQFGVGYQPSSQYKLREPLLKAGVERTKKCLKKQEEEWASTGCSIMTDASSDRKRRSIMNLCVNCKEGTTFLSSKETSDESHTGNTSSTTMLTSVLESLGLQVVMDNASNNMAATELLKVKRPNIFGAHVPPPP
ncbi:hypothetical protein RHMOL_Rhmol11G0050500 [Rhododendron molle]|uniref:Uncharacterized protein n=1 Tax=Rhododendron molle TaxID=49168 RepID=A0ACC0LP47_RHOML|nr:hypothetical protein RHMOL_Rhmol11G0050500 [Rhododendron molle]